jgi:hypothetical protein
MLRKRARAAIDPRLVNPQLPRDRADPASLVQQ